MQNSDEGLAFKKQKTEEDEIFNQFTFSSELSLERIRQLQEKFSNERNWNQFHTPRNLLLALVGEVGELSELFQWKGEVSPGLPDWSKKEKEHLGEELSDVLIYLIRLADKCQVDLPAAALRKIEMNEKKYPATLVSGSNKKYTEYAEVNGKLTTTKEAVENSGVL